MAHSFESDFPTVKAYARINGYAKPNEPTQFFDCKFYPYTSPGCDPVFAVVGKAETIVCRALDADSGMEIIQWFHDEDQNASINSCIWSQDLASGDPLLCVSGVPSSIKVFNVKTGKLVRTLIGHGKDVNDLGISPLSPAILASASMDHSVRLWSLDPAHVKQPCMLMCAGEGHKEGLLTLAFHPTGQYLLTGGMDNVVNLWTIPSLPDEATGTDKPTIIHYPHFSSSAIHTNYVDCVAWYHDLILSKCAHENKIVLWRIENFSSSSAPPPPASAPTTHDFRPTRSAFGGTYQRLLQFEAYDTIPFYMRFSLFVKPRKRPILVIGNEKSKVYFWDLQSLEEWDGNNVGDDIFKLPDAPKKGVARRVVSKYRESSVASTTTTTTSSSALNIATEESLGRGAPRMKLKFAVDNPFKPLLPHKTITVPKVTFAARQVAWSVGGEWMVVVGDQGMIALFGR